MMSSDVATERRSDERRACWRTLCLLVLIWSGAAAAIGQQTSSGIVITGGPDGSGQNYEWTVTNNGSQTITELLFPHYFADTFIIPSGWEQDCTNLQRLGATKFEGTCRAFVKDPDRGILPGRNAKFGMRLARGGDAAVKAPGGVAITLADGSKLTIADVTLPTAPSTVQKYAMTGGMAAVLIIFIAMQARRRRRQASEAIPVSEQDTPAA